LRIASRVTAAAIILSLLTGATMWRGSTAEDDPAKARRQKILRDRLLDHFMWGIPAPVDWMKETSAKNGAHWDIRDAYISGGAGDPEDPWWIKYGAADGMLKEGANLNCVVWYTWYALAQSAPAHYLPGPAQATPANAKIPATMKAYFTNFKRLLQICAKHPETIVVIQIEPDEWCHLLISGGMDPNKVDVKVGNCGLDELSGLPDNEFGWAAAFAKLRDTYAPMNVLLACNPSGWDWQGSMSGKKMGALFKALCAERYELATFETADRDKGASGQKPPYADKIAITGSLENHIKWISEFHQASGLYVVVWQVAMGNTFYKTCNNTPGHECDNLSQLLLEDYPKNPTIGRYVQAGCCGWLYQGGQGESTAAWDAKKDGVTNPDAIPGNAGNVSECADDDGGYIRLRVGNYYQQPFPILGKSSAPVASAKPVAEIPKPKVLKLSDTAALDSWKGKLKDHVIKSLGDGSHPKLEIEQLHAGAQVMTCNASGQMKLKFLEGGEMDYTWEQLGPSDLMTLAANIAADETPDRATAAFFCLLAGKPEQARHYFEKSPDIEAKVRAAFVEQ
jgi:hypothetical protein